MATPIMTSSPPASFRSSLITNGIQLRRIDLINAAYNNLLKIVLSQKRHYQIVLVHTIARPISTLIPTSCSGQRNRLGPITRAKANGLLPGPKFPAGQLAVRRCSILWPCSRRKASCCSSGNGREFVQAGLGCPSSPQLKHCRCAWGDLSDFRNCSAVALQA